MQQQRSRKSLVNFNPVTVHLYYYKNAALLGAALEDILSGTICGYQRIHYPTGRDRGPRIVKASSGQMTGFVLSRDNYDVPALGEKKGDVS